MKVYKILKDMRSLLYHSLPEELCINYKPGVWIKPKVGLIFCYDRLFEDAQLDVEHTLWEADAEETQYLDYCMSLSGDPSVDMFKKFWRKMPTRLNTSNTEGLWSLWGTPKGNIVGCKAIKLIRKLEGGEIA